MGVACLDGYGIVCGEGCSGFDAPICFCLPAGAIYGISYAPARIEQMTPVDIALYDVLGRRITTIYSRSRFGGLKLFSWDGTGADGAPVPPGVYFIRVSAGDETAVRKVVVIR